MRYPHRQRAKKMMSDMLKRTVTSIEPYKNGKGRYAVCLNDMFAFVLYKGELSQYDLKEGVQVSSELYDRIINETIVPRAKKRGMNLLMSMDRTESDIRRKLTEGGYPPEAVDEAVSYLVSFHYIDDSRYASEYIRFKSQSMSRRQITMKLTEKGIAKETILAAFSAYEEETGEDSEDTEMALIHKLIKKRYPNGITSLDYSDRKKLYSYLYGKGFSLSAIDKAVLK